MLTCVVNLGLKSMRAAVFDDRGVRQAIAYRPIESRMGEGLVEQDPELWWSTALEVLDEVFADRAPPQLEGRTPPQLGDVSSPSTRMAASSGRRS